MLVDEAELRSQTFGDADLLKEIVTMFAAQTPDLLAAMEAASGAGRSDIAHQLKGSALALGARALAEAAAHIETSPETGSLLAEARRLAGDTISALQAIARAQA